MFQLVLDILSGRYPPRCSADAAQRDLEDDAIMVIYDILDAVPGYTPGFLDWVERYHNPPAPPTDTSTLLTEMKATLSRDGIVSDSMGL